MSEKEFYIQDLEIPAHTESCVYHQGEYYFYKDDGNSTFCNTTKDWISCGRKADKYNMDGTVTGCYVMNKYDLLLWRDTYLVWEK